MLLCTVQKVFESTALESVLVACSGGVDSIVLADVAIECLGISNVVLGHVDHAIRPDSSDDAEWVEEWASQVGVRFLGHRLPPGPSDEARLRTARYEALRAQKSQAGLDFILTGHHQDDQAETVIMNLIRGTHWPSLAGIAQVRDDVLRPLLSISKQEILAYAQKRKLRWREDSTNREPHYLRNRIRKELLPLMETRYRPGLRSRLSQLAQDIRKTIEADQNLRPGRRDFQGAENKNAVSEVIPLVLPTVEIQKILWKHAKLPSDPKIAVFDSGVVSRLLVRRHRPGDKIRPFGMEGRKKLQDVLVDAKIPRLLRPWMLVVVDEQDHVLWVPGVLRSAIAPVDSQTSEVWLCRTTGQDSCVQLTDG